MEAILKAPRGTASRLDELTSFSTKHAASQTYKEYPGETKKALAEELSSIVEGSLSGSIVPPQELALTLRTLRLLSREDLHMQSLHNTKAVMWTMKLSGLLNSAKAPIDDALVIEEAMKCLVNVIVKADALVNEFVRLEGHWICLQKFNETLALLQLDNGTSASTTESDVVEKKLSIKSFNEKYESLLVPICRLLFTVTRPLEQNKPVIHEMRERNLLDTICEYLFLYSYAFQTDHSVASHLYVADIMRTITNLSVDLGALGAVDLVALAKYIPHFPRLIHAMHRFFEVPSAAFKDPIYNIHQLASACFVNVPHEVAGALFMFEDGKWPEAEVLASRIVSDSQTLCSVLSESIKLDVPKASVPLMMWMSNLARSVYSVRAAFLRIMFPNRNLEEEGSLPSPAGVEPPGYSAPTLGNAIIGLMTSLEMAVKHWTNELMYIIVDEDADLFVRLTGFGNAAGLLVNRGLFGMGGLANAKTSREDIENMTGRPLPKQVTAAASSSESAAAPSGSPNSSNADGTALSEEEEEAKAERLMRQLEDMERRGLVKLVRKSDNPDGADHPSEEDPNGPPGKQH